MLPHVSRALGVMFHLRDKQLQIASSLGMLERLRDGVLLLDEHRNVQFANPIAKRILKQGKGFVIEDRGDKRDTAAGASPGVFGELHLRGPLRAFETALQRAISDSLGPWSLRDRPDHFSRALVLSNEEGRPQYVIHVAPLGGGSLQTAIGECARSIVFVYDLAQAASVPTDALCELFGLTQAEARAALQILAGGSTADMAARLNVSVNTLKTQLQAAYAKTRTNRQVDMLKLLLSLATVWSAATVVLDQPELCQIGRHTVLLLLIATAELTWSDLLAQLQLELRGVPLIETLGGHGPSPVEGPANVSVWRFRPVQLQGFTPPVGQFSVGVNR